MKIRMVWFVALNLVCATSAAIEKGVPACAEDGGKWFDVWLRDKERKFTENAAGAMVSQLLAERAGETLTVNEREFPEFVTTSILYMLNKEKVIMIGKPEDQEDVLTVVNASQEKLNQIVQQQSSQEELDRMSFTQRKEHCRQEVKRLTAWIRLTPEWQAYEKRIKA